ncbi:hypothetical protein CAPTEDRAFT_211474, partial [Capitella teleta]
MDRSPSTPPQSFHYSPSPSSSYKSLELIAQLVSHKDLKNDFKDSLGWLILQGLFHVSSSSSPESSSSSDDAPPAALSHPAGAACGGNAAAAAAAVVAMMNKDDPLDPESVLHDIDPKFLTKVKMIKDTIIRSSSSSSLFTDDDNEKKKKARKNPRESLTKQNPGNKTALPVSTTTTTSKTSPRLKRNGSEKKALPHDDPVSRGEILRKIMINVNKKDIYQLPEPEFCAMCSEKD